MCAGCCSFYRQLVCRQGNWIDGSAQDESREVIPCTVLNYIVKLTGNWANLIYEEEKSTACHEFIMRRTYRQNICFNFCRRVGYLTTTIKSYSRKMIIIFLGKYCLFLGARELMSHSIWWCSKSGFFFPEKRECIPWWHMLTIWLAILCWYDSRINHTHSAAGQFAQIHSIPFLFDKNKQFSPSLAFVSCYRIFIALLIVIKKEKTFFSTWSEANKIPLHGN